MSISIIAFSITGCGSTKNNSTAPSEVSDAVQATSSTSTAESDSISALTLGKVVCDTAATRMTPDAEKFTKESWQCKHKSESLRIDIYSSSEQQASANQTVMDYYKSMNDNRALSELPMICGTNWGLGTDFNETRDALIATLNQSGITASTCK